MDGLFHCPLSLPLSFSHSHPSLSDPNTHTHTHKHRALTRGDTDRHSLTEIQNKQRGNSFELNDKMASRWFTHLGKQTKKQNKEKNNCVNIIF